MRLRYVYRGDFRKSEVTLYNEAIKEAGTDLAAGDCILLVSGNGKQLRFVHGFRDMDVVGGRTKEKTGRMTKVMTSAVHRIDGPGAWNPLMLSNYASKAGIELEGLRKFESYYRELIDTKER